MKPTSLGISPAKLVTRYLIAGMDLNSLAKLSVLEGIAGVKPGTWVLRGSSSFPEIRDKYGIDAKGFITGGENLYNVAQRSIRGLMGGVSRWEPDDIVQNGLIGLTLIQLKRTKPLFYEAGRLSRTKVSDIKEGRVDWKKIMGMVVGYARDDAREAVRAEKKERGGYGVGERVELDKPVSLGEGEQYKLPREIPSFLDLSKVTQGQVLTQVLADVGNPALRKVQDEIARIVDTKASPVDRSAFKMMIDSARRKKPFSSTEIAEQLGIAKASLSQIKARVGRLILDGIRRKPQIIDPALMSMDLAQLGYGHGMGRLAVSDKKLVELYLRRKVSAR